MTSESAPVPVPASVLFLRMRGWAEELPSEQARRRRQLAAVVRPALAAWAEDRRVVLEAHDGIAVVGEGNPAQALEAARLAAGQPEASDLAIALHHGPVRAAGEDPSDPRVQGDGVETAAALAGLSGAHAVVASQSFREALALRSPGEAEKLQPAGDVVDERLRAHALFVLDPVPARRRAVRRKVLGATGVLLLLAAGWGGREARERYEAARRPGMIVFDIKPSGEVSIDGVERGTSPPLVRMSLPPGPHLIEIRSGRLPPLRTEIQLEPGETMEIKHVFAPPAGAPRRARPQPQPRTPTPGERIQRTIDRYKFW